ncbi:hypothetical protein V8C37DRAFT_346153 [Trichoderma ceciliae]
MDFAAQYAFPGTHQAYRAAFIPLAPSHSQSAGSDDFNNTSPPDNFAGHLNAFDYAGTFGGHHHHQQQSAFNPSPPTPPNPVFGQHPHPGAVQQHQSQSPSTNASVNGSSSSLRGDGLSGSGSGSKAEANLDDAGRGSDDDEIVTPAQCRRKAQNRAAQRAFRERKEKHVKDLESKLANLEAAQKEAANENERLRRDLHRISTENEILRATSAMSQSRSQSQNPNQNQHGPHSPEPLTTGPMTYTPTDFYTNVLQGHNNKHPSHRIVTSDGHRLLAAGAAWDYLLAHPLYKRGLVDVSKVAEHLKRMAKCDGQGPVFSEGDVNQAIEQSVASGSDDLL